MPDTPANISLSGPEPDSAVMNPTTHPSDAALQIMRSVFKAARENQLSINDLFNVAERLSSAGNSALAIDLYRMWLAHTNSPLAYLVWFNLSVAQANNKDFSEVEQGLLRALDLNPQFHLAAFALGQELERQGRRDDAVRQWRGILASITPLTPDMSKLTVNVMNNLGRVLNDLRELDEAERMLAQSLALDPQQPTVVSTRVTLRQYLCAWPIEAAAPDSSVVTMKEAITSFSSLSAFDDPGIQLESSRRFLKHPFNLKTDVASLSIQRDYGHKKLRVGYLSSDFRWHAVSLLIAELLELHDRSRFEVYGFCWTKDENSVMRQRMLAAMDHCILIGDLDDEAAARCIRSHEIDVLVDLHGLATCARPNILSYRPAPVQVTYLGFPGPTGHPAIDYVIADEYVLPAALRPYFTETPIYLPSVFQVSDRHRLVGERPSRESCGLPEGAFIFCSFSNTHKITPEMFGVWMSILRRTPGSVLWLLADNEWAQKNMLCFAEQKGVDPSRIIPTARVLPHEYLARYGVADLFLDTFPFNAGTTANDALWMGLPILTYSGHTFASRMAGSLLRAAGVPELVTSSLAEYEEMAVAIAHTPSRAALLRRVLEGNRSTCPLFNIPQIVNDIEDALIQRVRALGIGSAPDRNEPCLSG